MKQSQRSRYKLRFQSLFDRGRNFTFPCDDCGKVDLDSLSDRVRIDYLYARAVVGRELEQPAVIADTGFGALNP